jgi:hypothetical protein
MFLIFETEFWQEEKMLNCQTRVTK